jgi:hypothetical protein
MSEFVEGVQGKVHINPKLANEKQRYLLPKATAGLALCAQNKYNCNTNKIRHIFYFQNLLSHVSNVKIRPIILRYGGSVKLNTDITLMNKVYRHVLKADRDVSSDPMKMYAVSGSKLSS